MRSATLLRNPSSDEGTFGVLLLDDHSSWSTGELPWRDNRNGISCIPPGSYICKWIISPKHGECYQITNVPKREMIEIHSANFMGDASLGKVSQLLGCLALGKSVGVLNGQKAILASKQAVHEFESNLNKEDFKLTIIGA